MSLFSNFTFITTKNKMKYHLTLVFLFFVAVANAQSDEKELTQKTYLLSRTVFGTKDSVTLQKLLAKTVSYGHSHGNVQTREEMIKGVVRNQSNYTDTLVSNLKLFIEGNTAIARYLFKAKENKKDGSVGDLSLGIMLVWIKEKKEWKLMGRQAVRVE
jgi:ketosteroid isomerase-like protein